MRAPQRTSCVSLQYTVVVFLSNSPIASMASNFNFQFTRVQKTSIILKNMNSSNNLGIILSPKSTLFLLFLYVLVLQIFKKKGFENLWFLNLTSTIPLGFSFFESFLYLTLSPINIRSPFRPEVIEKIFLKIEFQPNLLIKFLISYHFHLTSFLKPDCFLIKLLLCTVDTLLDSLAEGDHETLMRMLKDDPKLSKARDFTTGYTPLHWAAKHGNLELVKVHFT